MFLLFNLLKIAIFNIPSVFYVDETLLENLRTEEAMLISGMWYFLLCVHVLVHATSLFYREIITNLTDTLVKV